jgi:hypothetical protein
MSVLYADCANQAFRWVRSCGCATAKRHGPSGTGPAQGRRADWPKRGLERRPVTNPAQVTAAKQDRCTSAPWSEPGIADTGTGGGGTALHNRDVVLSTILVDKFGGNSLRIAMEIRPFRYF